MKTHKSISIADEILHNQKSLSPKFLLDYIAKFLSEANESLRPRENSTDLEVAFTVKFFLP